MYIYIYVCIMYIYVCIIYIYIYMYVLCIYNIDVSCEVQYLFDVRFFHLAFLRYQRRNYAFAMY